MKFDSFIFDIDGVLIDTSQSFTKSVIEAIQVATSSSQFTENELAILKSVGGFNNDWYAAIAGYSWVEFCSDYSFIQFAEKSKSMGSGLEGVRRFIPNLNEKIEFDIIRLVQETYGGTTACKKLYGFYPEKTHGKGFWQNERSLIEDRILDGMKQKMGIITGRSWAETELAFEILGWRLPKSLIAYSDNPDLDKPNPQKLIKIVSELNGCAPIYFGDTMDDLDLVKNYCSQTGKQMEFCLVGTDLEIDHDGIKSKSVMEFINNNGIDL